MSRGWWGSTGPADPMPGSGDSLSAAAGAAKLLAKHDPVAARADFDLITAVILLLRGDRGTAEQRLSWARYAYQAAERLVGVDHPLWLRVAECYRGVLAEQGLTVDAVQVCERRMAVYRQRRDFDRMVVSRCALADALRDDGQCWRADGEVAGAVSLTFAAGLGGRTREIVVLTRATLMAGCGDIAPAGVWLGEESAVLAGLDRHGRHRAATRLARTVQRHPACCERPHPISARAQRLEYWHTVLDDAAAALTRSGLGWPETPRRRPR
jgi:hypothetical protein